ncbi:RNA polymerase subunit sigma [Sphaerisporangium siamense]|uniref:Putative zinc-finger domain-containing protein n=1 Tax=Sphaerisporangium siamense TaxID=795645 RepID=A0A7W7GEN2_9ACTN|nr:zf-HC2 domain-containing protein [Sphaerisporangium siamense]MBB4704186.1 hypothetical protein [Sphaerisporangium siamense]GII85132.1 RNA polymerase subunit sigma [Sphaerisporangium siamense]
MTAEHTDVGAYALGLLEEPDRLAFAAHLTGCAACRAELAELSGPAGALAGVPPLEDDGDDHAPERLLRLVRRDRAAGRRAGLTRYAGGLAAAAALVLGGVAAGATVAGGPSFGPGHSPHGPAEAYYKAGVPIPGRPGGVPGVSGGLVLEGKDWGTHVALELRGLKGPLECTLVAVTGKGERRVVTGWAVPEKGYGIPGSPEPLYVHGGSAVPPDRIDRFEVTASTGATLLTVNV